MRWDAQTRQRAEIVFLVAVPLAIAMLGLGGRWILAGILGAWLVVGLVELGYSRAARDRTPRRPPPPGVRPYQVAAIAAWIVAFLFLALAFVYDGRFFWAWLAVWIGGVALQVGASRAARRALAGEAAEAGRERG